MFHPLVLQQIACLCNLLRDSLGMGFVSNLTKPSRGTVLKRFGCLFCDSGGTVLVVRIKAVVFIAETLKITE